MNENNTKESLSKKRNDDDLQDKEKKQIYPVLTIVSWIRDIADNIHLDAYNEGFVVDPRPDKKGEWRSIEYMESNEQRIIDIEKTLIPKFEIKWGKYKELLKVMVDEENANDADYTDKDEDNEDDEDKEDDDIKFLQDTLRMLETEEKIESLMFDKVVEIIGQADYEFCQAIQPMVDKTIAFQQGKDIRHQLSLMMVSLDGQADEIPDGCQDVAKLQQMLMNNINDAQVKKLITAVKVQIFHANVYFLMDIENYVEEMISNEVKGNIPTQLKANIIERRAVLNKMEDILVAGLAMADDDNDSGVPSLVGDFDSPGGVVAKMNNMNVSFVSKGENAFGLATKKSNTKMERLPTGAWFQDQLINNPFKVNVAEVTGVYPAQKMENFRRVNGATHLQFLNEEFAIDISKLEKFSNVLNTEKDLKVKKFNTTTHKVRKKKAEFNKDYLLQSNYHVSRLVELVKEYKILREKTKLFLDEYPNEELQTIANYLASIKHIEEDDADEDDHLF